MSTPESNRPSSALFFGPLIDRKSIIVLRTAAWVLFATLVGTSPAFAQKGPVSNETSDDVIEQYVQLGLESNPALTALRAQVAMADASSAEASRAYLPSLGLQSRYTRSAGGRTIEFPVGDLLNPVYGALNGLTGTSAFPTIPNEEIRFLRKTEQETKASLLQPVFLPSAKAWKSASQAGLQREQATLSGFKRDLGAQIRDAYLVWSQARAAVEIVVAAEAQIEEAHRATQRLLDNGMATNDAVFKLDAEWAEIQQQVAASRTHVDLAQAAFNTLLSRPVQTPIEMMSVDLLEAEWLTQSRAAMNADVSGRSELMALEAAGLAAEAGTDLARSERLPQVVVAADLGVQGTRYAFTDDRDFRTASVVATWTLFDGRRRSARIQQALAQERQIAAQRAAVVDQLELEAQAARWRVDLAETQVIAAREGRTSAASAYRLTERKYREGLATVLELLDAQRVNTLADQQLLIARIEAIRARIELVRVTSAS